MSRPILEITLRLANGKVLTGRGRNLPATIERTYNTSQPDSRKQVTITEDLKTGHRRPDEHRYEGTFHVTLTGSQPRAEQETAIVEVRRSGVNEIGIAASS